VRNIQSAEDPILRLLVKAAWEDTLTHMKKKA